MHNNNHIVTRDHVSAATPANPNAAASASSKRHATLTLAPCKKQRHNREPGKAFGGRLECAGHAIWIEDAITLGVVAFVMNIGTVELRLPTFPGRTSKLRADEKGLPPDVIALAEGISWSLLKRQDEAAEALFVRRFATALRLCTQSKSEVQSLVAWYRANLLPAAVRAVPRDLRVNERI